MSIIKKEKKMKSTTTGLLPININIKNIKHTMRLLFKNLLTSAFRSLISSVPKISSGLGRNCYRTSPK